MLSIDPKRLVTREYLRKVPVTIPNAIVSSNWVGIQHGHLVDTLIGLATERGLEIKSEQWGLSKDTAALWGSIDFTVKDETLPFDGAFSIALRTSNDCQLSLTFAVGARVFVCSNGMLVGRHIVRRRHTIGLKLPDLINTALDMFEVKRREITNFTLHLRTFPISNEQASNITMDMARLGFVPWNYVRYIDYEYRNSKHAEFSDPTRWSLYNAMTEVIKKLPTHNQLEALAGARDLLTDYKWRDLE